jgi:heparosan-N-sulfate-glucuronate 5-epimerase
VLPRGRDSPYVAARLAKRRGEQVDERIVLTKNNASHASELGEYYIDFVPSFSNYAEYRYGVFDERGVPLVGWSDDAYYNPVTLAQYGFLLHALHARGLCAEALPTLEALLAWFEANKEESAGGCFWRQAVGAPRYGLKAGFVSAMASGEAISFYLRMYQLTGDASLLATARAAYAFLRVPFAEGGVRRTDARGDLWFEEYPSEPPSYVLNGFIYCLFGLYDLLRVSGDPAVRQDVEACLKTLRTNLPRFDTGYWSVYDLLTNELVSVYYQRNVHLPQVEVLHAMTGDPVFAHYAERWRRDLRPLNRLLAQVMMRVRPRISGVLSRRANSPRDTDAQEGRG